MNDEIVNRVASNYEHFYEEINNEFISGLEEGVKEGIKEGVKNGILNGLSEISALRSFNIKKREIKSISQILRDSASENIEEMAEKVVKEEICPVMKKNFKNICETVVTMINKQKFTINKKLIEGEKIINIRGIAEEKIKVLNNQMKIKLPQSLIFSALFNGVQKASGECLYEDIKTCEKKIQDLIKSKTTG